MGSAAPPWREPRLRAFDRSRRSHRRGSPGHPQRIAERVPGDRCDRPLPSKRPSCAHLHGGAAGQRTGPFLRRAPRVTRPGAEAAYRALACRHRKYGRQTCRDDESPGSMRERPTAITGANRPMVARRLPCAPSAADRRGWGITTCGRPSSPYRRRQPPLVCRIRHAGQWRFHALMD